MANTALPKGYMIFNPSTGEWSKGGCAWGATPKIWASLQNLKSHLRQHYQECWRDKRVYCYDHYKNCSLIDSYTGEESKDVDIENYCLDWIKDRINKGFYKGYKIYKDKELVLEVI